MTLTFNLLKNYALTFDLDVFCFLIFDFCLTAVVNGSTGTGMTPTWSGFKPDYLARTLHSDYVQLILQYLKNLNLQ